MKNYNTPKELGRAWMQEEISEPSITSRNGVYTLTADPDVIWNGDRLIAMIRRHRALDLVLALRPGSASMGAAARNCMRSALEVQAADAVRNGRITYLDSLQDPNISNFPLKRIQDLVLASSTKILKGLIVSFRAIDSKTDRYQELLDCWKKESGYLKAVSLTIPQELETKKLVSIAKHRLFDE